MKANFAIGLVVGVMACAAAGTVGAVSAQEKSQWDGVYSREQAQRGEPLYAQHCSIAMGLTWAGARWRRAWWAATSRPTGTT